MTPLPAFEIPEKLKFMMDESGFALIFALFIVIFIVVAILGYYAEKKRREELFALAAKLGLEYSPADPFHIEDIYDGFDCISRGHRRSANNVIYGRIGNFEIKAFDYHYYTTESSTDSKGNRTTREQHHQFSAVVADTDAVFRKLFIRPEGFMDRIAGAIGFDDIDFESDEFSRRFHVSSEDKKFAYDVIHTRMMEFLLANPGWNIQLLGRSVMFYNNSTFSPVEVEGAIMLLCDFLGLFPEYLWQDLKSGWRSENV